MSWEVLGTITPSDDWIGFIEPLQSQLLRLSVAGDTLWLEKFQPRAYLRLRVGDEGYTKRWETIWPKTEAREIVLIDPVLMAANFLQVRKLRNPYSLGANYEITIEQFVAEPYLIDYAVYPLSIDGSEPLMIDGAPMLL